nr:reverse transcriptase domain-containing protein [Tanacetum cinerariifolium]
MMVLQPHSSGVKIQDLPCPIIKDKYMMKVQVHVSKSSAISDIQALPQRKHYCQIYQVGPLLSSTIANPKEEDERVEETLTDPKLGEYTIKVPPPLVQKAKPPSQRNYVVPQRDPLHPNIPYPSRIKYTPQENCSSVILKKLPEKLRDPEKFLIPCGFSELKCMALADLEVINPLSESITSSSLDYLLEDFIDELTLITFPPENDDLPFDIESDLREIEYLLNHDPNKERDSILEDSVDEDNLADLNENLFDTILEMFTEEHTLDYLSTPLYDDFDDDLDELEYNNDYAYNDPFDFKEDKIKESKLLIDELDPLRSSDFLSSPEYDLFLFEKFFEVDALPSTNNEDKDFLDFEDSCLWFYPSITRSSHPQLHFGNPIS